MKRSALIILVAFLLLAFNSQTIRLTFAKVMQNNEAIEYYSDPKCCIVK